MANEMIWILIIILLLLYALYKCYEYCSYPSERDIIYEREEQIQRSETSHDVEFVQNWRLYHPNDYELLLEKSKYLTTGYLDVHYLYLREAIAVLDIALNKAYHSRLETLKVITGRGKHSKNGVPVLKPNLIEHFKTKNLRCEVHPRNSGVLIVHLSDLTAISIM